MAASTMSSLFLMEKLIKLVSRRIWYGGPRLVLCLKNNPDDTCSMWCGLSSPLPLAVRAWAACLAWTEGLRGSEGAIIFLTTANLRMGFLFRVILTVGW